VSLTSLWLVMRAEKRAPKLPEVEKPEVDIDRMAKFWVKPSINPHRQRKGKSGEIARRGPW
jgi:hypothetical protein